MTDFLHKIYSGQIGLKWPVLLVDIVAILIETGSKRKREYLEERKFKRQNVTPRNYRQEIIIFLNENVTCKTTHLAQLKILSWGVV